MKKKNLGEVLGKLDKMVTEKLLETEATKISWTEVD